MRLILILLIVSTISYGQNINYESRYGVSDLFTKIVDNQGNGFEELYGTRNMRVVLKGLLYRGGANNYYHRSNKRSNINPLPDDGIENLCQEGFSSAVYLYSEKFDTAPSEVSCKTFEDKDNNFNYLNLTTLNNLESLKSVFTHIYNQATTNKGPVYIHCWNGWHASGYTAATSLMQFCGKSSEEAVQYWDRNTDGNNTEPRYDKIRDKIRNFKPFSSLKFSQEMQEKFCF